MHYRKLLLCHILSKIEECNTASEVVQSVTILNAVRWVAQAWEKVTPETIQKCFRKAGILNREFQLVSRVSEGDDEEDQCGPCFPIAIRSNDVTCQKCTSYLN